MAGKGKPGRPPKVIAAETGTGEIASTDVTRKRPGFATPTLETTGQRLGAMIGECMAGYWREFGAAQGNPEQLQGILTQLRNNVGIVQACVTGFETLEQQIVSAMRIADAHQLTSVAG